MRSATRMTPRRTRQFNSAIRAGATCGDREVVQLRRPRLPKRGYRNGLWCSRKPVPFTATHPRRMSWVLICLRSRSNRDAGLSRPPVWNVELIAGDVAAVDVGALGHFDYIITHGLYSWVPAEHSGRDPVRGEQCTEPGRCAYLSYNVYPGWKSKEIVRDAMRFAARDSGSAEQQVIDARVMVDFLEEVAPPTAPLARAVAEFRERDNGFEDSYLVHDELAAFNRPAISPDARTGGGPGLAFLAEAQPELMFPANYGPRLAHVLQQCGDSPSR